MAALRPHLRTCLSCRAALRDAREVPARVAALAPVGLLAAGHGSDAGLWATLRATVDWLNERVTWLALRGQEMIETASSHKLAAAAASAAALGGGGIATVQVSGSHHGDARGPRHHAPHVVVARPPVADRWRPAAAVSPSRPAVGGGVARAADRRAHERHRSRASRKAPIEPVAPAPGAIEPASPAPPVTHSQRTPPPAPSTGEFGP
jgi:hypothetical protein